MGRVPCICRLRELEGTEDILAIVLRSGKHDRSQVLLAAFSSGKRRRCEIHIGNPDELAMTFTMQSNPIQDSKVGSLWDKDEEHSGVVFCNRTASRMSPGDKIECQVTIHP